MVTIVLLVVLFFRPILRAVGMINEALNAGLDRAESKMKKRRLNNMMNRDMELEGINGNIKIDEYNEMEGYSVAESTAEYLAQWAKDNAQDQAVLAGEPLACEFFKAGYTKNGKLWICFKTPANKLGVLSLSPALAHDIAPDLLPTEATYKVSPRGLKLYAGEQWTLTEKEINAKLQGYTIAVQFEERIIKGKDGKPDEKRTVPRLLDIF